MTTNPAYAMCAFDPENPFAPCNDTIGTLEYPKTPDEIIPAPLKQMNLGIKLGHIICDPDKYPVWNVHYKPACVYPDSEGELLTRGWAKLRLLLPAGPDPIKELEAMGQNVFSLRILGNYIVGDEKYPLSQDRKRELAWEYSQQYHPGQTYLEYAITPHQNSYNVGNKIQFDLLEWGNYSDCWNLKLKIIDVKNNPVYEDNSVKYCLEPDGNPGTFHSYSIGEDFEEFVCERPGYYRIEVSNGKIFSPDILQNFVCLDHKPEPEPSNNNTGWITDEDNTPTWVSLPITSCDYPWHESNHEKTKQYFEEYKSSLENYDSSSWQDVDNALHYVIMRYYEDLGIRVFDVKTSHDGSLAGMGKGCGTTIGGTWHLQILPSDLSYFLNNGFVEKETLCFVIDSATSGESGSAVSLETCFPLSGLDYLGCDKPILEHLHKYSNLLDEDFDGSFSIEDIGFPDGVSQNDFDECVDFIYEKRTSVEPEPEPDPILEEYDDKPVTKQNYYISPFDEELIHEFQEYHTVITGKVIEWYGQKQPSKYYYQYRVEALAHHTPRMQEDSIYKILGDEDSFIPVNADVVLFGLDIDDEGSLYIVKTVIQEKPQP